MPSVIKSMSATLTFFWTLSFFGHFGFAPVETGNSLPQRGKRPLKGGKGVGGGYSEDHVYFTLPGSWAECDVHISLLYIIYLFHSQEKNWVCITALSGDVSPSCLFSPGSTKKNAAVLQFMINIFSYITRLLTPMWEYRNWGSWREEKTENWKEMCSHIQARERKNDKFKQPKKDSSTAGL